MICRVPKSNQSSARDFADVAYNILKGRNRSAMSKVTIEEVNNLLDKLANQETGKKAEIMSGILQPVLIQMSVSVNCYLVILSY